MTCTRIRSRLVRSLLACGVALAPLACAGPARDQPRKSGQPATAASSAAPADPYDAAYDAGRAEADAEVAQERPRWLRVAESTAWDQQSGLDPDTLIPWIVVGP